MSIFGSILGKIFGTDAKAEAAPTTTGGPMAPKPTVGSTPSMSGTTTATASKPAMPAGTSSNVDVNAVLTEMASHQKQTLDWKHSIVDLLKLLDLDSSLTARKELAKELDYTGSTDDSAAMNMWLHRQVMHKLAENGGKVPAELKV